MLFSSLLFLYAFLPICLLLYFLVPGLTGKNIVLLCASLVFYAWGEPVYVFLMLAVAALNWGFGLLLEKRPEKLWLALCVALNLVSLVVFKYAGFLAENCNALFGAAFRVPQISLPIGISFYTFQALSYSVDVYRKDVGAQRSYWKFLLYVSMFPQLIAGPIVRYVDVAAQIESRESDPENVFRGVTRFCVGLGKKVLLADHVGQVADQLLGGSFTGATTLGIWLGALMYMFQIYFDFSGYSDMAIGLGRIFGFRYMENFKLPYTSKSISEFWRRWHISLSSFFRDYVYIPLGGNRRHVYLNLFIVWALTGLWHGASWNFVLWGLLFFCTALHRAAAQKPASENSKARAPYFDAAADSDQLERVLSYGPWKASRELRDFLRLCGLRLYQRDDQYAASQQSAAHRHLRGRLLGDSAVYGERRRSSLRGKARGWNRAQGLRGAYIRV